MSIFRTAETGKMPQTPPIATKNYNYADSLWCTYVVSVVAASIAEIVTYPFDLTKTRLQIQGEIANKKDGKLTGSPHRGMIRTALGIAKEEGIFKLWQGVTPALLRHVIYSGTRIVVFKELRDKLKTDDNEFPLWQSAFCGVLSGCIAQYISSPTDLIKVQLQMEGKRKLMGLPPRVHGVADAFNKIVSSGGVKGLWKGSVVNVQRAALVNLGDLTTYDVVKRNLLKHTTLVDDHLTHTLASICAGFVAAGMGTPADVIKTRIMNQPMDENGRPMIYKSSWDCLKSTVRNEGFFALYKGFFPIWMRLAPWSLTFWLSFEEIRRILGAEQY